MSTFTSPILKNDIQCVTITPEFFLELYISSTEKFFFTAFSDFPQTEEKDLVILPLSH